MDFRYCPNCTKELEKKEKNLVVCPHCDFHFYFNPAPTNGVIVENDKGEILLVKRKFEPAKGKWDLPGGFVDVEETAEQSVVRELKEELGVTATNIKYLTSISDLYPYKGRTYQTLGLIYSAVTHGNIVAADDAEEVKFFSKNSIPFKELAFPSLEKALTYYLRRISR